MKAIILSSESFLVKTEQHSSAFGDKVVKVNTKDTMVVGRYEGGFNEDVPVYYFCEMAEWEQAEKQFKVEDLVLLPKFQELFNKVSVAEDDQFQSEYDYLLEQAIHHM